MSINKKFIFIAALVVIAGVLAACAGPAGPTGPAGPAGPQGEPGPAITTADLTCTQCHNDGYLIAGKEVAWASSVHGKSGDVHGMTVNQYAGPRATCTGCHSGSGFSAAIAAGVDNAAEQDSALPNPGRIDCRACHQIHTTYTKDDFALTTTDPVSLVAIDGATYDGGAGNLCAHCHQPRTAFPAATDSMVKVTSTHWGAHHGPVASMILGVGAAGGVEGKPAPHYGMVEDTCVTCHMGGAGENADHTFAPNVATCTTCHADAKNFDINGVQTEVADKLEQVKAALQAKGLLNDTGKIVVGDYPEAQAAALWNYIMVEEDKSMGVHNADYAKAMLDAALEALK